VGVPYLCQFIWMVVRWSSIYNGCTPPHLLEQVPSVQVLWDVYDQLIPIVEVLLKLTRKIGSGTFWRCLCFFPPDVDDAVSQGKSGPKWRFARFLHSRRLTSTVPRPKLNLCPFHPALCDLVTINHILFVKANLATNHLRSTLVSCLQSKPQS